MAADPNMLQCGLELNVDKTMDEIIAQNFVEPENALTHCTNSSLYPMGSLQTFSAFNIPQTMPYLPDLTNWNTYGPPTEYIPRLDQQPAYSQAKAHQLIQQARTLDENGGHVDWNKPPPTREIRQDLKHPSPSDWEQWRPIITAQYKHDTARMILKQMSSEGHYVIDKMLRQRIRQWSLNTKNKRSVTSGKKSSTRSNRRPQHRQESMIDALMSKTALRPAQTCADDALQRNLLCSLHHYFDYACEFGRDRPLDHGHDVSRLLNRIDNAISLAAGIQSKAGWETLRRAETELQQANWSRISPHHIIRFMTELAHWDDYVNKTTRSLRKLVKNCISCVIGERHPVILMFDAALCRKLDLETCCRFLAMADTRATANTLSRKEKQEVDRAIRRARLETLWQFEEYAMMEDILQPLLPRNARDEIEESQDLADAKLHLGKLDEAERLYLAAWEACSNEEVCQSTLLNVTEGHAQVLLQQARPQEAINVFLDGLLLYENAKYEVDSTARGLDLDWFRWRAELMRADFPDSEGLDLVTARLDAMSLQS